MMNEKYFLISGKEQKPGSTFKALGPLAPQGPLLNITSDEIPFLAVHDSSIGDIMICECFDIGDTHTGEREQVATESLSQCQSSEYQRAQQVDRMQQ